MATKKENNTATAVVEQDVDVDAAEKQLKDDAERPASPVTAIAGGSTKWVGRHEFIRASQVYRPRVEIVDLPEPFEGRQIKVRELTAGERDRYEGKMVRGRLGNQKLDMTELRIGLIQMSAVEWDDESRLLFDERDKDDLRKMGISVIQAIYNVASKLSAVSKEDEDELAGE
jgi:hypothetical protein